MRRPSVRRLVRQIAALATASALGVGAWTRQAARTEAAEQRRADAAGSTLAALFADAEAARRRGEPIEPQERLRRARQRVAALPEASPRVRTEVLATLGAQLAAADQAADAEAVLNEAVDLGRAELGEDHAQTDAARVQRALLYRTTGRQKEARVEVDALLPRLRDHVRSRPRELVSALQVLALVRGDEGKHAEAAGLAREALAIADARLGQADPLASAAALVLARALQQTQDAGALVAAQDALQRTERAFPGDAPEPHRIEARTLLGRALAEAGELERGISEMNAALDATRVLHGRDSLEAALAAQSLVAWQVDRGLLREANRGADEALRILLRVSLRRSYNVGAAFDARGVARLAARRDADARDNLVVATQTLGVMIGHDHPATRLAKAHLAQALLAVEGEALAEEAVRDIDFPPAPPGSTVLPCEAAALRVRATARRLSGRPQEALALLDRAAARIAAGHRAAQERAVIEVERGRAWLALGRADAAKAAFEAALAALQTSGSLPQPLNADAQVGLGRALLAAGDAVASVPPLQAADAFWRGFDAGNPWAAEAVFWLARALQAAGRPAERADADSRLAVVLAQASATGHSALTAIRVAP